VFIRSMAAGLVTVLCVRSGHSCSVVVRLSVCLSVIETWSLWFMFPCRRLWLCDTRGVPCCWLDLWSLVLHANRSISIDRSIWHTCNYVVVNESFLKA